MKKLAIKVIDAVIFAFRHFIYRAYTKALLENENAKIIKQSKEFAILGYGGNISPKTFISHPRMVSIGNNVFVGGGGYFHTDGGLVIGDNTHISRDVVLYTSDHVHRGAISLPYDARRNHKGVTIGRNVWIGMRVSILPGVTIGDGAIIGLGTTVAKSVPSLSIIGQQPFRVLGERDINHYAKLEELRCYGASDGVRLILIDKFMEYNSLLCSKAKIFFVLGTGRSGTHSISSALDELDTVVCKHEARAILIQLSSQYLAGEITRNQAKEAITLMYSLVHFNLDLLYGESDQKFAPFVDLLAEIFTAAKFIWVIREPRAVISSTVGRGWFNDAEIEYSADFERMQSKQKLGGVFSQYRWNGLGIEKFDSSVNWNTISQFERNCWYWLVWNNMIHGQLKNMQEQRWIRVRLEDFSSDEILAFLGVDITSKFQVRVSNAAHYRRHEEWSNEEKTQYHSIVTPYLGALYHS
jgi:acetyltransferase-like isoleucine patch superfamily enzyme